MNKARLLKLAEFLEQIPNQHFNLQLISCGNKKDLIKVGKTKKEQTCKAVACAIGWSPVIFPELLRWTGGGLVIYKNDYDCMNFRAAMKVYEISYPESNYLFSAYEYPTSHKNAKYVANRIRSFVKNGKYVLKEYVH